MRRQGSSRIQSPTTRLPRAHQQHGVVNQTRLSNQLSPTPLHTSNTDRSSLMVNIRGALGTSHARFMSDTPSTSGSTSSVSSSIASSTSPRRQRISNILKLREDLTDLEEELYFTQRDIERIRNERRGQQQQQRQQQQQQQLQQSPSLQDQQLQLQQQQQQQQHRSQDQMGQSGRAKKRSTKWQEREYPGDEWDAGNSQVTVDSEAGALYQAILQRQNGLPDPDNERGAFQIAEAVQSSDDQNLPLTTQSRPQSTYPRQMSAQLQPGVVDNQSLQSSPRKMNQKDVAPPLSEILSGIFDHDIRRPVQAPYAIQPRVVHGSGYRSRGLGSMQSDTDSSLYLVDTSDAEDRSSMKHGAAQLQADRYRAQQQGATVPRLQAVNYDNQGRIKLGQDQSNVTAYRAPQRLESPVSMRKKWLDSNYNATSLPAPVRSHPYTDSDDDLTEVSQRILSSTSDSQARMFQRALERRYGNEPGLPEHLKWRTRKPTDVSPDLNYNSDDVMLDDLERDRQRQIVKGYYGKYHDTPRRESRYTFDEPGDFYRKPQLYEHKDEQPHYYAISQHEIMTNPVLRDEYVKGVNRRVKQASDARRWGTLPNRGFSTMRQSSTDDGRNRGQDDNTTTSSSSSSPTGSRNQQQPTQRRSQSQQQEEKGRSHEATSSDTSIVREDQEASEARANLQPENVHAGKPGYDYLPLASTLSGAIEARDNGYTDFRGRTDYSRLPRTDLH